MASKKQGSKSKGQSSGMIAAEVGAGVIAAAAAAGAGYYFYGAKDAKKNRAAAAKWTKDMKNTVVKETKKLGNVSQESVAALVDKATKAYDNVKGIDKADLQNAARELKANWKEIQKEIANARKGAGPAMKRAVSSVKKSVSKKPAAKKSAKKAVKKPAPKKAAKRS